MRDIILQEIRRLAQANNGKPPGRIVFERETGIRPSSWSGVYWARWGDAVSEAGFQPNAKQERLNEEFVFRKLVDAFRHYKRVPTTAEMYLYRKIDGQFPNYKTIESHFKSKTQTLERLAQWVSSKDDYNDILSMLPDLSSVRQVQERALTEGYVYLIQSGSHYKIGRSDEIERRIKEIRIALPEAANMLHVIKTDDPAGIETYWHRRFADRRANGEWFKLTTSDVAAFKRRKFQ